MTQLFAAMPAADLLDGEVRGASLPDGRRVALYNINGAYYATDDLCTHEHASLSDEGSVEGGQIICGWHFCGFDIASGAATVSPCSEPLQTYPVRVVEGTLHVEV